MEDPIKMMERHKEEIEVSWPRVTLKLFRKALNEGYLMRKSSCSDTVLLFFDERFKISRKE